VDYVLLGQVLQAGAGQMPARQAAVNGGIPMSVPSMTINKVCLSGINAIYLADQMIQAGDAEVVGDPERALERARSVAGPAGMVLATGSIYLVAGLAHARRPARARMP